MSEPADEIDSTLVDAMLALSPQERIRQNDRMLRMIEELRHGLIRVLSLATIIDLMRGSSRLKDQRMLPILEAALARKK